MRQTDAGSADVQARQREVELVYDDSAPGSDGPTGDTDAAAKEDLEEKAGGDGPPAYASDDDVPKSQPSDVHARDGTHGPPEKNTTQTNAGSADVQAACGEFFRVYDWFVARSDGGELLFARAALDVVW
jgi:hypothetical protein